jgi:hypothetical protein
VCTKSNALPTPALSINTSMRPMSFSIVEIAAVRCSAT